LAVERGLWFVRLAFLELFQLSRGADVRFRCGFRSGGWFEEHERLNEGREGNEREWGERERKRMNIPFPQTPRPSSPAQPESETSHPETEYATTTPRLISFPITVKLFTGLPFSLGLLVDNGMEREANDGRKKWKKKLMRTTDQRVG
jgi:hypothetical protein